MINTEEVVRFIEKTNKIKLYDFQIKMLDAIIHGRIVKAPRSSGKTTLINGYTKYLQGFYDGSSAKVVIYDEYVSFDDVAEDLPDPKKIEYINLVRSVFYTNPDRARREYNLDFTSKHLR